MFDRRQALNTYLSDLFKEKFDDVVQNLSAQRKIAFRVNELLVNKEKALASLKNEGFDFSSGPFENAYLLEEKTGSVVKKLSESEAFNSKWIHIQSLSSMAAVYALDPKPGESVLDLCAAPGSKTTLIANLLKYTGQIIASEKSKPRFFSLKSTLELSGVSNTKLYMDNGIGFDRVHPEYVSFFDKVLIDAPCTNESLINPEVYSTYKFWNPKKYKDLSRVQKGVLIAGYRMLKPGGTLLYSTCTFNPMENEAVVDWLLEKFDDVEVEKVLLSGLESAHVEEGKAEYKTRAFNKKVSSCRRVLPDTLFEGFFIAKLKKAAVS